MGSLFNDLDQEVTSIGSQHLFHEIGSYMGAHTRKSGEQRFKKICGLELKPNRSNRWFRDL